jgi:hypothetical protein
LMLAFWWLKVVMKETGVSLTDEGVWIDYGMWMRWVPLEEIESFVILPRKRYSPLGIKTRGSFQTRLIPLTQYRKMSFEGGSTKNVLGDLNSELAAAKTRLGLDTSAQ